MSKMLTNSEAWALIEKMGWSKQADYNEIARTFFKKLGTLKMQKLEKFVKDRASELYSAVTKYESETGGELEVGSDDGFSDLRYHIVGMGKLIFDESLADPQLMQTRYSHGNYKESFIYCFMAPEPARTKKQKEETFTNLVAEIERLNFKASTLADAAVTLKNEADNLSRLMARVLEDKKSI